MTDRRIPVAILGATGIVGQRLVQSLEEHPQFEVGEVAASASRMGAEYGAGCTWNIGGDVPRNVAAMRLKRVGDPLHSRVVLSALPSSVARTVESELASAGHVVCTNSSVHRLDADVPLMIPELNPEAIYLVERQPWYSHGGALVANSNCVVAGMAPVLAPIQRRFGIKGVTTVTLQALSGAGQAGLSNPDSVANVIPWIPGEEEKIGPELNKILGTNFPVASAVNRVPVIDGHTAHVFLNLGRPAGVNEVVETLRGFKCPQHIAGLPSIPGDLLLVHEDPLRPQPIKDAGANGGLTVSVGRIRRGNPLFDIALVVVVHNGIRGAATACLANAELCLQEGLVDRSALTASSQGPDELLSHGRRT